MSPKSRPEGKSGPKRVSAEGKPVSDDDVLLELKGVSRTFDVSPPWLNRVLERKPRVLLRAVENVDLTIRRGETLGLVEVG